MWRIRTTAQAFFLLCTSLCVHGGHAPASSFISGEPNIKESSSDVPAIVVGFVGGFVAHDDAVHSPVQLAGRIREAYRTGVYAQVFENRHRERARRQILQLLDANHDGRLSVEEKRNARIIIYGMSWGGSETVALARELNDDNIPVLLTIQVDSVAKVGQKDDLIPSNVAEAANFYQQDGLLHGRPEIRAEDPSRTQILGNFRSEYGSRDLGCRNYPWYDRVFVKQHTQIECDPAVWNQVESLIRSKLPHVKQVGGGQP